MKIYDVILIGAGPASLTAAIYLGRAQIKSLVIGDWRLGNLYKAHIVGNYPGFPKDISGNFLIEEMVKQCKRFKVDFLQEEVINIVKNNNDFLIKTDKKKDIKSKVLVLCPGKAYKMSNIKNEKELTGKGVSYCVTCDGLFFKNKKVAVLGSKNLAAGEALELLNYTKKITIFTNGRDPEFSEILMKDLKKNKVKINKNKVVEFEGKNSLNDVVFDNGEKENFDAVFIALGTTSAINFANKLGLELDNTNIMINKEGKTSINGVWAAGDCTGSNPQAVVSAGEGCNAAISIIKYLKGKNVYLDYD